MSGSPEESLVAEAGTRTTWVGWFALIVLLGIVLAIWIPSRADYTHRIQTSEAISLAKGVSDALTAHFAAHGEWPASLAGLAVPREGKYTLDIVIAGGAGGSAGIELTATLRSEGVDQRVAGKSIRMLSQDGGKTWQCLPGTAAAHHLPQGCRPPQ